MWRKIIRKVEEKNRVKINIKRFTTSLIVFIIVLVLIFVGVLSYQKRYGIKTK